MNVAGDISADARRWFGSVDLTDAPEAARTVLAATLRMLDALQPSQLDPAGSKVSSTGHRWTLPHAVEIHLRHRLDRTQASTWWSDATRPSCPG